MDHKTEEDIAKIEQTQKALRESIEQSKKLAEKTQDLLQKHREELEKDQSKD